MLVIKLYTYISTYQPIPIFMSVSIQQFSDILVISKIATFWGVMNSQPIF